jgi:hypothetical protein
MSESGLINGTAGGGDGTGVPGFMARAAVTWLVSSIVAVLVCVLVMKIIFKGVMPVELLAGYGLASINAAVALVMNMAAMRKKGEKFVACGIAVNVLRAAAVLAVILLVRLSTVVMFEPFVAAFLAGYFVFMIGEIIRLNKLDARDTVRPCLKP